MSTFDKEMLACDLKQSTTTKDGFIPVMTPENIPQFTIPPLSILESKRIFRNRKSTLWKSNLWHSQDEESLEGKTKRSFSLSFEELPDPVTKAAMSLPHLAKITTPYGFLTLAESPLVPNGEAVFFQMRTSRIRTPIVRSSSLQNNMMSNTEIAGNSATSPATKAQPTDLSSSSKRFPPLQRAVFFRQCSMPLIHSGSNFKPSVNISERSNSFPKIIKRNSSINLLQSVLKKHFSTKKQD